MHISVLEGIGMRQYREVIITLIGFILLVGSKVVECFFQSVWMSGVGLVGACLMLAANIMATRKIKKERNKNNG